MIDDALLRKLFIRRLPANVQMALGIATALDLTALVTLADAVTEVVTPSVSNVASATQNVTENQGVVIPTPPQLPPSDGNFEQICQLLEQIILAATHRRPRTQKRRGSLASRRRNADHSRSTNSSDVCYYHRRFGSDARHCLRLGTR